MTIAGFEGLSLGINGVIELPEIRGWDSRRGITRTRRFKCRRFLAGPASTPGTVEHILQEFKIRYQVEDSDNGQVIVNATWEAEDDQSNDVPLSDEWEKEDARLEKSLWEIPKVQAVLDFIFPEEERAFCRNAFDALLRGERKAFNSADQEIAINLNGLLTAIATAVNFQGGNGDSAAKIMREYFGARVQGVEAFPIETHTVTRTRVVPRTTSIRPAEENVDRILTRASMTSLEHWPGEEVAGFQLPIAKDGTEGFWLKCAPKVKLVGSSKRQIIQTYEFTDYFSKFVYGDAI